MAATAKSNKPHILVFPYPAQGHLIPLLDFTHHLAVRTAGRLDITILVTPKNLPLIQPLLSRHPSTIQTLVLPFPPHPSIPPGVENTKDLPPNPAAINSAVLMMAALGGLRSPLLQWLQSTPSPPSAILSDMFLGWTHRLGIPRIVFSPSAAVALSVIYSLWRNMPPLPENPNSLFPFPTLPNSPNWPASQLSPIYRSYLPGDPVSEFVKDGFIADIESWGIVFNSFHDLESKYFDYLRKELGHDRVWAVGPILPAAAAADGGGDGRGGASSVSVTDLEKWLDACPDDKVVYVCFGSEAVLTGDQTAELASGLEKSNVHFVWSVKGGGGGGRHVPMEFEERVAGRGVVIRGWAPQVTILSHRAVGAFLTHCGWNSVLEGIVAGVPMLTWPMGADQFIDATLLVDELKVGVRVCEGPDSVPDSAELARQLRELMAEEGREERKRAKELSRAAAEAVRDGGSSARDLDSLVNHLVKLTSSGV